MIQTELNYNPYLGETNIKFNGNDPRINSLVEKYTKSKLQSWIKELPSIFHDEMNGYDFELLFSGTNLEFTELVSAFSIINTIEEQVKLVHINKIESRDNKVKKINNLIEWLRVNRNRKFNYEGFLEKNNELMTEAYHYVVLHAELQSSTSLDDRKIKIENILDITELQNTNLNNTAILICVNREVLLNLQNELSMLLSRSDVDKEQLFFYIDRNLNKSIVERTIKDLEVFNPQILKAIDDEIVLKYFDVFPITEYISKMIIEFEKLYKEVKEKLDCESEIVAVTNKDIHEQINKLDSSVELLTNSNGLFKEKDEIYLYDSYQFLIDDFEKKLYKWRSRKTKLYSYSEASDYALELSQNIVVWREEFKKAIELHEERLKNDIYIKYNQWYKTNGHEVDYLTKVAFSSELEEISLSDELNNQLMELKEEHWVTPGKGLLAQIFNVNEPEQEPVLQTTWQLNIWREHVEKKISPILISMINTSEKALLKYAEELLVDYQYKLKEMLNQKLLEKDRLINQLSNEERQLEIDYIWLSDFKSQLTKIEKE